MSWVQALLEWLRTFWPFVIVMQYERGVRYWRGQVVGTEALMPDWYWCVPFFMDIHTIPVMPDILKLWNLNLTTRDGASIRVRANIRYEVFDAIKAYNEVQDYKDNLADECRTSIARVIRAKEYIDVLAEQDKLERECKNEMNKVVKDWGIKVIRVGYTDFIRTIDLSLANV